MSASLADLHRFLGITSAKQVSIRWSGSDGEEDKSRESLQRSKECPDKIDRVDAMYVNPAIRRHSAEWPSSNSTTRHCVKRNEAWQLFQFNWDDFKKWSQIRFTITNDFRS